MSLRLVTATSLYNIRTAVTITAAVWSASLLVQLSSHHNYHYHSCNSWHLHHHHCQTIAGYVTFLRGRLYHCINQLCEHADGIINGWLKLSDSAGLIANTCYMILYYLHLVVKINWCKWVCITISIQCTVQLCVWKNQLNGAAHMGEEKFTFGSYLSPIHCVLRTTKY